MLQTYVSSVLDILEVYCNSYMNVAKVDQDVAFIAMAIHVCCKRLFQMFHLFLDIFYKCIYLDVA
jgi:hypothetical protein